MADITRSLTNLEDISEGLEEIRRAIMTGNEIQERIAKALEEIMQTVLEVNK